MNCFIVSVLDRGISMTEASPFQPPNSGINQNQTEANRALEREAQLPMTGWQQEVSRGLEFGLEAAESIRDRTIPTFSRGELPHYAGINTFLKAPYLYVGQNSAKSPSLRTRNSGGFPTL